MRVLSGDIQGWEIDEPATAVTIGVFDGVHRGHHAVLDSLAHHGSGLPIVVVSFADHPMRVLAPERAPALITTLDQRLERLAAAGVDVTALLEFDEQMRTTTAEDFVSRLLVDTMHARLVAVGSDFRFGHERRGDVELLRRLAPTFGFEVMALDLARFGDVAVSSTEIRRVIGSGDVAEAARLLGRPFTLRGRAGAAKVGVELDPVQIVPAPGVYSACVQCGEETLAGLITIDEASTSAASAASVALRAIDTDRDLTGEMIDVGFIDLIRDPRPFVDDADRDIQLDRDIEVARVQLRGT
jgi:riboflavin kinase/FMN adenylyltransferase